MQSEIAGDARDGARWRLFERARAMLRRVAAETGSFSFVDPTEALPLAPERVPPLFLADGHFSADGAAWYAELVREAVIGFVSEQTGSVRSPTR